MTLPNDETPILVDAESRQNSSQNGAIAQDDIRTAKQVRAGRVQLVALCASLFLHGWTNGVVGPLIPSIQKSHQLSYPKVSLVFVLQNVPGLRMLFVRKYCGSELVAIREYLRGWEPAIRYRGRFASSGSGNPVLSLPHWELPVWPRIGYAHDYINILHRFLPVWTQDKAGICTGMLRTRRTGCSPGCDSIRATLDLGVRLPHRGRFGSRKFNQLVLAVPPEDSRRWKPWPPARLWRHIDWLTDCLAGIGQLRAGPLIEKPAEELPPHGNGRSVRVTARAAISLPAVHYIAGFVFICVGVEVMTAGWIVTYMIEVRGGGPSSGYVASGFWAGLMAGRVVLLPVNKRLGEVSAIYAYTITLVGLEFIIWLVPNLYASAIAASLAGLLIGPMFPIAISQAARILPSELLDASIAWASAICGAGAAVLPLISGAIAGRFGFKSVQPFTIATLGVMLVVWSLVPRRPIVR
ncbi:Bypass of stop codon protein 6 [Mycena kentingensis (nom. inval.)]|nr:Bypass of stop codon protein 6 [Mycena kentingensis (nom. inval.)]